MELKVFQEQVFFSTIRITVQDHSGKSASIGTGFILRIEISINDNDEFAIETKDKYYYYYYYFKIYFKI